LFSTAPTDLKDLPKRIPNDAARYHFFLYKHSHEGDYLESTGNQLFIDKKNTVCVYITFYLSLMLSEASFI